MELTLKNFDSAFLPVLESFKSVMPTLTIEKSGDNKIYTPKFIKTLKKDEIELKKELKNGKLKTFDSAEKMRIELGL